MGRAAANSDPPWQDEVGTMERTMTGRFNTSRDRECTGLGATSAPCLCQARGVPPLFLLFRIAVTELKSSYHKSETLSLGNISISKLSHRSFKTYNVACIHM